jgi:hypothetical protein
VPDRLLIAPQVGVGAAEAPAGTGAHGGVGQVADGL